MTRLKAILKILTCDRFFLYVEADSRFKDTEDYWSYDDRVPEDHKEYIAFVERMESKTISWNEIKCLDMKQKESEEWREKAIKEVDKIEGGEMGLKDQQLEVLNLYAGAGGNRELWDNVSVTAVEQDPEIADIYQQKFPRDTVIVGDAHQYLLDHYSEYNEGFIWGSRPCPTHSRARFWRYSRESPVYPDFGLYEEIIFLEHHFKGLYSMENVVPYYTPLIQGKVIGRHMFWSNFPIGTFEHKSRDIRRLSGTSKADKIERNKVDPEIGLYILNCARGIITKQNERQTDLFE